MECFFCKIIGGREPQLGLLSETCFSCAADRGLIDQILEGSFDPRKYIDNGGKQDGTTIQSVILWKERFPTMESALEWIKANGFSSDKVDETDESFRFRQRDPAEFDPNGFGDGSAFRTIMISEHVSATVGFLLQKSQHTHTPNADGSCRSGFVRRGDLCVRSGSTADSGKDITGEGRKVHAFVKVDDEKRIVTGPVLVPNILDLQGDFEFAEDIEKAAHGFLANRGDIGRQHEIFDGIGVPVESHLTREPIKNSAGKTLPVGTWVMSVKITHEPTWQAVKRGEVTGFSIGFRGIRSELKAVVGTKDAGSKAHGIFHLHDISVHEVSLVDHGAIDEMFTETKSKLGEKERREKARGWIVTAIKEQISAGKLAEKSGIDSKAIEAIKTDVPVDDRTLIAIALSLGFKGVSQELPQNEEHEMNKEEIVALIASSIKAVLAPLTEKLGEFEKAQKEAKDLKAKAEADAKKAKEDGKSDEEKSAEALTAATDAIEEMNKQIKVLVEDTVKRFERVEGLVTGKSSKLNSNDDDGKKEVKWPSFSGMGRG